MAMAVDQQLFGPVRKLQVEFATLMQLVEEFIDGEGMLRHERGICSWHEIEVVLAERQNTTGLNPDDRHTLSGIGQQQLDIVPCIRPALLDLPLRDGRSVRQEVREHLPKPLLVAEDDGGVVGAE